MVVTLSRCVSIFILLFILIFGLNSCSSQKNDKASSATGLFLPDDLEATLFAESPLLFNPTNIDIDSRGRVWVTEAVNYRNFKNDSLTHFHHSKGDRVVILEDTDNDGKADTAKTFVQDPDLTSPVGLAVIGNKVYVSCSPNLIVYTDDNGDDIPDHKEIFLTGFGGFDHDHSLHAVFGGPDGALYFNTGNAGPHVVTDKSGYTLRSGSVYYGGSPYNKKNEPMVSDDGRKYVGGLALRVQPDGKGLKVMGHNFRNSYEVFVDSYGNLWQNDNDDQVLTCRFTWLPEGGNAGYFNPDGNRFWQADQRPGQDIFKAHWHQEDPGTIPAGFNTGAGSPTGVLRIETDILGEQYKGMLLSADAGRNVIFGFKPQYAGSGYLPADRINLVTSLPADNELYVWDDSSNYKNKINWFRPSDAAVGTDGSLFVADWYDPVVGGHQMSDSTGYGRIYRITPKGKTLKRPEIDLSTTAGQIAALKNPAIHVRYLAAEKLRLQGDKVSEELNKLLDTGDPFLTARVLWILASAGEKGRQLVWNELDNSDPQLRVTAIKALRNAGADIFPVVNKLLRDSSAFVRRELIVALKDSSLQVKKAPLMELAKEYRSGDRWYLEALGAAMDADAAWWYDTLKLTLSSGKPATSSGWSREMADIAWRLHSANAVEDCAIRAADSTLKISDRLQMVDALAFIPQTASVLQMVKLAQNQDTLISQPATYWLSFRQGNDWFALADWKKIPLNTALERRKSFLKVKYQMAMDERQSNYERRSAVRAMALDSMGGRLLITLAAAKILPEKPMGFAQEFIFKNPDPTVRIQAGRYFERPGLKGSFNIDSILAMQQDEQKGKAIFQNNCGVCHKINGAGNTIGPDLSAVNKKFDAASLLDAIINPDGAIVFGYETWMVNIIDGQPVYGFLMSQDKNFVVIKDISGEKRQIETAKIKSMKKQDKGLMPDPGSMGLSQKDLADVVGFIKKQK